MIWDWQPRSNNRIFMSCCLPRPLSKVESMWNPTYWVSKPTNAQFLSSTPIMCSLIWHQNGFSLFEPPFCFWPLVRPSFCLLSPTQILGLWMMLNSNLNAFKCHLTLVISGFNKLSNLLSLPFLAPKFKFYLVIIAQRTCSFFLVRNWTWR